VSLMPLIRKLETLHALDAAEKSALERLPISIKRTGRHEDIVREGDKPSLVCLIVDGFAFRYTIVGPGKRQIMAFYIPGDIPDLESLFLKRMDHSLGTLRPSTIATIPHDAIKRLFESRPRLGEVFWLETLIDAAVMRKWLASVGRRSALACLAHVICEFVTRMSAIGLSDGISCEFPMTQTELGDAAGLSLVHVNRTLRELRRRGLATLDTNLVTIHDWAGLKKVADFDPTYLNLPK
jgi:CRP-like cAMP-binding protein